MSTKQKKNNASHKGIVYFITTVSKHIVSIETVIDRIATEDNITKSNY